MLFSCKNGQTRCFGWGVMGHKLLLRGVERAIIAALCSMKNVRRVADAEIWLLCSMKNGRQNGVGEVMVITLPVTGWVKVRLRACRHRRVPSECLPYNVSPTMGQPRPC